MAHIADVELTIQLYLKISFDIGDALAHDGGPRC
jgi:hypothetical protein